MTKIYDWITGKGKLRSEIQRENRVLRNIALCGVAVLGMLKGIDYCAQKQAERRAEIGYDQVEQLVAPQEAEPVMSIPRQDPVQRANLENSATNQNMPYANNFDISPEDAEAQHPVTPEFIDDIIHKGERTTNPKAVSPKGARGLMQIMPDTWNEVTTKIYGKPLNYNLADNPETNRIVGTAYLNNIDEILTNKLPKYSSMTVKQKQEHIAAGYNGGPFRLARRNGDISRMPRETRNYVKRMFSSG